MIQAKFKRKVFEDAAKVSHLTYHIGEADFLREKSQEVNRNQILSSKIQSIIKKLKRVLKQYKKLTGNGKGISAVQIGVSLKIAVIFIDEKLEVLINPKIIEFSKGTLTLPEICMSANPIIAKVKRPSWVKVAYLDESGNVQNWEGDRENKQDLIINRVLQHEIDHMEGVINIDRVASKDLVLLSSPKLLKKFKFREIKNDKTKTA